MILLMELEIARGRPKKTPDRVTFSVAIMGVMGEGRGGRLSQKRD